MNQQVPHEPFPTAKVECRVWQEADFASARSLKRELLAELEASHESGHPCRPEDLLVRWPTDPRSDPDVASLLFADYQQRVSQGESLDTDAYEERFPEHRDSLARLFRQHEVLRSLGASASEPRVPLVLPGVGDELFGFRLRHELGSGAFARVFLAEQASLAGRPVVLKTSDLEGDEPQTLAQLQHTHIVPIHSVHEDATAGLRAVCMPYFGGASLSAVLKELWATNDHPSEGAQLLEALDRVQAPTLSEMRSEEAEGRGASPVSFRTPEGDQTPRAALRRFCYPRAVAWIVARLGEGLQHAHERRILHRDIKPSNILLTADAQPMLLDFNLSQIQQEGAAAVLGGTVAYMAPEHLRALTTRNPALLQEVDHRSDIYSLGMVLFEMLTGHNPFDQSGSYSPLPVTIEAMAVERARTAPSLRECGLDISWNLESIARKCLAPNPAQRYQQAEHLALDLRRFLEDRPLAYAPELSWSERLHKWFRRHPRATSSGAVALAAALLLLLAGVAFFGVRARLEEGQSQERKRAYQEGTVRALMLVNVKTDLQDLTSQGRAECENTLAHYGVLDRDDWQEHPHWRRLDESERVKLGEDTRELLLLLAWARVRLAPGDQNVLREALALLHRAETIRGLAPSPALWHDRAMYRTQLGDEVGAEDARRRAAEMKPGNARDHYLLAAARARSGDPTGRARAIEELNQSVRLNPKFYWAWLQRGICHLKAGDPHLAASDFSTCVGLWPEFAWGHFNLGCAHAESGHLEEAIRSHSAALERDPGFVDAYLNRGMVLQSLGRFEEALTDFTRAVALRPEDAALHAGRGQALEALGRTQEADDAFGAAFARLPAASDEVQTRVRCGYGFAVYRRLPEEARNAFDAVLARHPRHPRVLYGRAMLAAEIDRAAEAVVFLQQAIAADPLLMEARRHLAIQLARCKRFDEAFQAINWCLFREPRSGAALYAAACVTARAAEQYRGTEAGQASASRALALLREAFAQDYGRDSAGQDPDLSGIRDLPEFEQLVGTDRLPRSKSP
jgi:serine/threonine protein kinase/tetratricopeptide (TPR) repeat protein